MSVSERLDPRIRRTRQAIEGAFEALLNERGLLPLTVQDITARAGVNRATFYAHYTDKHALFARVIRRHLQATVDAHLTPPLHFEAGELRRLLRAVCVFMAQVYDGCHVHDDDMAVHIERQVQEQVGAWLLQAQERSAPAPGAHRVSRQTLATLTASAFYAAAAAWGQRQVTASLDAHVAEVMVVIQGGLTACGLAQAPEA